MAPKAGVGFTYLSKVENGRLDFGEYPGEYLIRKLAKALGADEDELLLLAEKVPDGIRRRVVQRPDAFRKQLSRARRHFAQFLINAILPTLVQPQPQDVVDELTELGLMSYVRDFLPEAFRPV